MFYHSYFSIYNYSLSARSFKTLYNVYIYIDATERAESNGILSFAVSYLAKSHKQKYPQWYGRIFCTYILDPKTPLDINVGSQHFCAAVRTLWASSLETGCFCT